MNRLITWWPTTRPALKPGQDPEYAEVLQEVAHGVYIHPESGKDRWIPEHWIIDDEEA